jgi:hypothetical protein
LRNFESEENRKIKISVAVLGLILAALACNMPTQKPTDVAPQAILPLQATLPFTPTAAESDDIPIIETSVVQAPVQTTGELTETDACKLYDVEKASLLMGDPVTPPTPADSPEYSVCTFLTQTRKVIYVSVTKGDQAKKNFLNEIGQYQKGCSVGYSGGTSTATPFPPDIEALMSKSLPELFVMDMELQAKCGRKIEPLPEFGPNAYLISADSEMIKMASVGIVSGDNYYGFVYGDPTMDIAQMGEKAKEVARAALSQ